MREALSTGDNRKRKPKKRSLMQRMQRLGQSKTFCNSTKFDSDEFEYFVRVFKMTRNFEGTYDEKIVFANNSLAQTENREVECSSNQLISRVIESLLPLASNKVLERYFNVFGKDLRPICNHDYASHVLQALMVIATRQSLQDYDTKDDNDHKDVCHKWILKVSKYLVNNIEEYISEKYANPVLRTMMYCLAGLPQMDKHDNTCSKKEENNLLKDVTMSQTITSPPEEYKELLEEFFTRISSWPHFKDFVDNSLQSGYLQCLLTTLHHVNSKKYRSLRKKILSECFPFDSNDKASVMFSPSALPLLEILIEKGKRKELKTIYERLLAERVGEMATVKVASFTVKKFLDKCDNQQLVAEIASTLLPELPKILACHHDNLVVSLCEACERLKTNQSEFLKALMKSLNCDDNNVDQLVPAALAITPLPHQTPLPSGSRLGSMLVQSLLRFQKPIKIINSLLSFSPEQLMNLLSLQYGTHITTAFCKSEFVGEKSRQKLIQRLMGHYPELATSKFGSRSFDDIWDVADEKSRLQIVKDLSSSAAKIRGSHFGKFVATKVHLEEFNKLGADKWMEKLQSIQTKRKIFDPIIGSNEKKRKTLIDRIFEK